MTTQKLPGTQAARHGSGDADLSVMLAAHDAFRRDLISLARAVPGAVLAAPARQRSVAAGWQLFKDQLHMHHTGEDELIWPALRDRLGHSEHALSVLDEMEQEHGQIDPLLAAVDGAFAALGGAADGSLGGGPVGVWPAGQDVPAGGPGVDRLGDVTDALASTLTGHLAHEEKDCLPLIGRTLTATEWRGVGFRIARRNGLSAGGEMFAWMLDGGAPDQARSVLGQLPPPVRVLYRAVWKPRYGKTERW